MFLHVAGDFSFFFEWRYVIKWLKKNGICHGNKPTPETAKYVEKSNFLYFDYPQ